LKVVDGLLLKGKAKSVQFIVTTHAPLVLGSVESTWDASKDQLFDFVLIKGADGKPAIRFFGLGFTKYGSVENWLESESFDLTFPSTWKLAAPAAVAWASA
jgi:hypothetical protein